MWYYSQIVKNYYIANLTYPPRSDVSLIDMGPQTRGHHPLKQIAEMIGAKMLKTRVPKSFFFCICLFVPLLYPPK